MLAKLFVPACLLILGACGAPSSEPQNSTSIEKGLSTQLDALEKAEGVEKSLQQAADQRAREIQQKGG